MIRVLVVDDSAVTRQALTILLNAAPDIEVVGTARDGAEALERVAELQPDVLTMDVEMPHLDGLTALRMLMRRSPRPVLMVSTLTQEGAATTVEALSAGAVDFIPKDRIRLGPERLAAEAELHQKVRAATQARTSVAGRRPLRLRRPTLAPAGGGPLAVIAIGVSTGGPFALHRVIPQLPADLSVPVLIVQHMPPRFTRSLAERLDATSPLRVVEAEAGQLLEPGLVVIARGGEHLLLQPTARGTRVQLSTRPPALHTPSVDCTFEAAARVYGAGVLAVVMTGMGKDGLEGARAVKAAGGRVLAQDEATCVVYGMPRAVAEAGLTDAVLPLDALAPALAAAVASPAATPA